MRTMNEDVNQGLVKVKRAFREALLEHGIKQEAVAIHLEVNQSTVHRWTDPDSELDIPLGALPLMHQDERLRPVAEATLDAIGARFVSFSSFKGLNGSIDDELLLMMEVDGLLARMRGKDKKKLLSVIRNLRTIVDRMEAECMREEVK